ncbi:MAG: hypothetical protein IKA79_00285, partial [Lentisphaeria bacterium]|nr:hypothetical protein [Lentisphaeria bacterium]
MCFRFFLRTGLYGGEKGTGVPYPAVVEAWQKGILSADAVKVPELPSVLPEATLEKYSALYSALKDPSLRSNLAFELRKSHSTATFRKAAELLEKEKDPFCKSALLSTLQILAEKGYGDRDFAEKSLEYLSLYNTESKKSAVKLYLQLSSSPALEKVLEKLDGKGEEYLLQQFFPVIMRLHNTVSGKTVEKWQKKSDPAGKGIGMALALLRSEENKGIAPELLKAALPGNPYLVRYYLARAAAYKKGLDKRFYENLFGDGDA